MRYLRLPRFPRENKISDFDFLVRSRLSQTIVIWPQHAVCLVGYMGWPNDPEARAVSVRLVQDWANGSQVVPRGLRKIQTDWCRVADIMSLHRDLAAGGHQKRRGGPSIGKAIALAATNSKSRGTRIASLWKCWTAYKDVAHLATATAIIHAHVRERWRSEGEFELSPTRIQPLHIAMLMPDFVIALALWWQKYGLEAVSYGRQQPLLDPETVWRIGSRINVVPISRPERNIRPEDIQVLNARRAGNRGRANRAKDAGQPSASAEFTATNTPEPKTAEQRQFKRDETTLVS